MQEFDLRSIFFLLIARAKWIIAAAIVGTILLGSYATFVLPEEYTSSAMLYMTNLDQETDSQAATSSNLSASERLVKTVRTATTAPWALEEASEQLDGVLSPKQLSSVLHFSLVQETSFLKLSVTYTDPELAQRACDVMAETAVLAFAATGETGNARVYQKAVTATKTSPHVLRLAMAGGLVGFLGAVAIIVLSTVFGATVCDKDDVQRHLNVPVLGEIPSFKVAAKGGKRRHV